MQQLDLKKISRPKGATRRPRGKQRHYKAKAFSNRTLLWFLVGLTAGVIVTALTVNNWLNKISQPEVSQANQKLATTKTTSSPKKVASNSRTQKSFDFYTLLPKYNLSNQQNAVNSPSTSKHTLDLKSHSPNYVVQVSSFKSLNDAEELKAQLTLQGFTPNINSIRLSSGESWYRVTVGPFNSHETAKLQQSRLAQEQYSSTLVLKQK